MAGVRIDKAFKAAVDAKLVQGVAGAILDSGGKVVWKGASGVVNIDDAETTPFDTDSNLLMYSCTKIVTCVAALQLVEQGKLGLDELVEKYVPSIADTKVLEGFENDNAKLRDPKSKPTVLNLMTHTSGLGYDFFDGKTLQWRLHKGQDPVGYVVKSSLLDIMTPMAHDPGAKYTYGTNIDYLGWVVENVSGLPLDDYFQKNIIGPLEMKSSGRQPVSGKANLICHFRGEDGKLTPHPEIQSPEHPEVVAGGHYLYSTIDDFSQFLVTLLNEGTHPRSGVKILNAQTVRDYLFEDFIPKAADAGSKDVGFIPSEIPQVTNVGEFFPGIAKGHSCGLLLNLEDLPNGRKRGSGAWAGLGNLYYWIDIKSKLTGIIGSNIFPFFDTEVKALFDEMERAAYEKEPAKTKGGAGCNHVITKAIEVQ